jgi:glycosyltransferase involved in cell wall biosynthesis
MSLLVSIIIPVYNEGESVTTLLTTIQEHYKKRSFEFEVILVNDGSVDETKAKILNFNDVQFDCQLITFTKNYGSHSAIKAGFLHARGDYAVYLPADLQITFETIEKMYLTALSGYEVVTAVRFENNIGRVEKIFSRIYSSLMRRFVIANFPNEGLETLLINKKVRAVLNANMEDNSSFALQILSFGFKNKFIPIEKNSRKQGKSKWTISKKIKLLIDSFVAFSYAPIRFVTMVGIFLFIAGLLFSAYLIVRKLIYNDLVSGWPMLISILTIGFGITNISLGIIAEYLWRTLDSSRKRPVFIIDEIIDLKNNDK